MATAASTPTTIPAIAPPEGVDLPPVFCGSLAAEEELVALVAVVVAGDGEEVGVLVADADDDADDDTDADDDSSARKPAVLFVTLNDKISLLEG